MATIFLVGFAFVSSVKGEDMGWLSRADPLLTKVADIPRGSEPVGLNTDCMPTFTRTIDSPTARADCVVSTALGQFSRGMETIQFSGSNYMVPIVPPSSFFGLMPVPNQGAVFTFTSAPIVGVYLHVYRSIYDKLPAQPDHVNGRIQYTINQLPDYMFRDSANQPLPVNHQTITFSSNGNWVVFDSPWRGMVRVNLATFEITPFSQSLQQGNDYNTANAQIAISNNGQYVVVAPRDQRHMYMYDLETCEAADLPIRGGKVPCQVRDYWDAVEAPVSELRVISEPRFVGEDQLSFYAMYNFAPKPSLTARYTMSAPGRSQASMSYLGLGDSFASGQGAFAYVDGTDTANNTCHTSIKSYPFLLSSQLFEGGKSVACSGAKTADIINDSDLYEGQVKDRLSKAKRNSATILTTYQPGYLPQKDFVDKYNPEAVTLSIGGNDIGFADILQSCVSPLARESTCYSSYEDQMELMQRIQTVFAKLTQTYAALKTDGRRVYIVGYPKIAVPGGNCALNVHLSAQEIRMADTLISYLNATVKQAADTVGVRYVDVSEALAGHRMCETPSDFVAINGFTIGDDGGIGNFKFVGSESYHPNALGHDLLGRAIRGATNGLKSPMPAAQPGLSAPALPSLDHLSKENRSLRTVVPVQKMATDSLIRGTQATITIKPEEAVLKSATSYNLVLHSDPVSLGNLTSGTDGSLTGAILIPANVPAGFHTLHIYGLDMANQPIDMFKTVYIAASSDDLDGDGTPNITDPCFEVTFSGQDIDADGVDEACDATVGQSPNTSLPAQSNSVQIGPSSIVVGLETPYMQQ